MKTLASLLLGFPVFLASCTGNTNLTTAIVPKESKIAATPAVTRTDVPNTESAPPINTPAADAATIMSRKQVPVLCYHHIHDFKGTERPVTKDYIVPPANFREQMKRLADSGYHTILPEQYNNYLLYGTPLPSKPVMITFDDTDEEQYTIGNSELSKYGFKGVYFIMTISIGKPRYMTKEQIKDLSDKGNTIACHTWDHHNVKKYTDVDWP